MNINGKEKTAGFNTIVDIMKNQEPLLKWDNSDNKTITKITFSFPNWSQLRGDKYKTLTTMNKSQEDIIRKTLQQYSDIANVQFIEKDNLYNTHIKFGVYNNINELTGDANYTTRGVTLYLEEHLEPNEKTIKAIDYSQDAMVWINIYEAELVGAINKSSYTEEEGNRLKLFNENSDSIKTYVEETDEWFLLYENTNSEGHINNQERTLSTGSEIRKTIIHEIGHALKLPHTFIKDSELPDIEENSTKYAVMAYRAPKKEDADFGDYSPMNPLILDTFVIQQLYGKNMNTRVGDTIYGFNSNTQRDYYTLNTADDTLVSCIWDGGGNDTFDFSKYNVDQRIDLNEGTFSDIGGLRCNISIAYDAIIENAKGGLKDDHITVNSADNCLWGEKGNDTLLGREGNDTLYGGDGDDFLYGDDGNDILFGNKGKDTLFSGVGNDLLYGGSGDDTLIVNEGNNILHGGYGNDTFIINNGHNIISGSKGEDSFIFNLSEAMNSNNTIFDFNKEDTLSFKSEKDKNNIKVKQVQSFSGNKNELMLDHDNNKTIIKVITAENSHTPNLVINITGEFSYDELFS